MHHQPAAGRSTCSCQPRGPGLVGCQFSATLPCDSCAVLCTVPQACRQQGCAGGVLTCRTTGSHRGGVSLGYSLAALPLGSSLPNVGADAQVAGQGLLLTPLAHGQAAHDCRQHHGSTPGGKHTSHVRSPAACRPRHRCCSIVASCAAGSRSAGSAMPGCQARASPKPAA